MKENNQEDIINNSINSSNNNINTSINSENNIINSKKNEISVYKLKLISKQKNEIYLTIENKESELSFICYYCKDFFKYFFKNSFSLEKLKEQSNYFNQFSEIKQIFTEIYFNSKKGKEYMDGNENLDEKIKLIIPLESRNYPNIQFELKKIKKEHDEIFEEYKNVITLYKNQIKIKNFKSKILLLNEQDKKLIKSWISPIQNLEAKLLYSFYISYEKKYDLNEIGTVRLFHEKCDNKKSILVICKSNDQIFGGYTPLRFKSDNSYGKDNKSFLFSLNSKEKYPKNNYDSNESIWRYENYGPSFHWDLYFRKYKMNTIKLEKKNYLTPQNWVNENKCIIGEYGILLDSLEIFQITINNKPEEDEEENEAEDEENNIKNLNELSTDSSKNQKDLISNNKK